MAQAVFLLAWAGYHEFVRQNAPVILLKGRPVDPQDLLRGDYMTMGYDINVSPAGGGAPKIGAGSTVGNDAWVLLEKRDGYHVVVKAITQESVTLQDRQSRVEHTVLLSEEAPLQP